MKPRNPQSSASVTARIDDEAADWLGRRDGGLTPAEEAQFTAWLGADSRHAAALSRLEAMSEALDEIAALRPAHGAPDPDLPLLPRPALAPSSPRWRRAVTVALAAAAAVTLAWIALDRPWVGDARFIETAATEVGGLRRLSLPDGSTIELNTDSSVVVDYSRRQRRVSLTRGEAHFTVAKDPERPFVVRAGGVDVRAVGTAFNVRLRAQDIDVLVTEGRVRLADAQRGASLLPVAPAAHEPAVLAAGQRAQVPTAALAADRPSEQVKITPVPELEITRLLAWQAKRLEFEPTPLREVVAEFNRYNSHQLVLGDPAAGEMLVGGSFAAGDYDTLVRLLEASFGVTAERSTDRTVLRVRR